MYCFFYYRAPNGQGLFRLYHDVLSGMQLIPSPPVLSPSSRFILRLPKLGVALVLNLLVGYYCHNSRLVHVLFRLPLN